MDFISEMQESEQNRTVQKLHLRDVMEYIIDANESTQKQLITLLDYQLKLTPIQKAVGIIGGSYNGIKNFGNTQKVGTKIFAVLK
jgi:hypothetical protein